MPETNLSVKVDATNLEEVKQMARDFAELRTAVRTHLELPKPETIARLKRLTKED